MSFSFLERSGPERSDTGYGFTNTLVLSCESENSSDIETYVPYACVTSDHATAEDDVITISDSDHEDQVSGEIVGCVSANTKDVNPRKSRSLPIILGLILTFTSIGLAVEDSIAKQIVKPIPSAGVSEKSGRSCPPGYFFVNLVL